MRNQSMIWLLAATSLFAGRPALAQQSPTTPPRLTVSDVISMTAAGISDPIIIMRIRIENKPFELSTDDMVRLKKANVSDAVVTAMLNPAAAPPAQAEGPPTLPPVPPSTPAISPAGAQPNGAAPAPKKGIFQQLGDSLKAKMGKPGPSGMNVIDTVGLRNILPQYDRTKPVSQQFPHVAIRVLSSPPMWGDMAQRYVTLRDTTPYEPGCWSLQATVWSDEQHSKVVGPFDWCVPRDVEIKPGVGPTPLPNAVDMVENYRTGNDRTDGPRPPDQLIPNDRDTQALVARNTHPNGYGQVAMKDLNGDRFTRFSHMFANILYGMGSTFADGDWRVWIVSIR